jgi:hypothetical protein
MAAAGQREATMVDVERIVLGNATEIITRASFGMEFRFFFSIWICFSFLFFPWIRFTFASAQPVWTGNEQWQPWRVGIYPSCLFSAPV